MLIQFELENYGSFKTKLTFSMVASSYSERSDWVLDKSVPGLSGMSYLLAAGIYGANASGKSMLIDAIATMRQMVGDSAFLMPGEQLPYNPFRLDSSSRGADTVFELVFEHDGVRYDYLFSYNAERISREELRRYIKKTPQLLFAVERGGDNSVNLRITQQMIKLKKLEEYLRSKPNSLLLSRGAQEGIAELVDPYRWISKDLLVYEAPFNHADLSIYGPIIDGSLGEELKRKLICLARDADLGIIDIVAKEAPQISEEHLKEIYTPEMIRKLSKITNKTAVFKHQGDEGEVEFSPYEESIGTRSFLSAAGAALMAMEDGKTLFFDEIDSSLHPTLSEELIKLFASKQWNPHGAQLIFSAHTMPLMDLLRRDQIWKTEKGADGQSSLEPLSDYSIRKGELKSRGYEAGRYGGVPFVDFK